MPKRHSKEELDEICRDIRCDIMKMLNIAGSGHSGGSMGSVEIMVALYWNIMNHNPENPAWSERDYFILSKGHCCPTLYAILARWGYFKREELWTLRQYGSILQGHPSKLETPGIEASTGSLGQGLSIANGIALAFKKDGKDNRVYCLNGDGELQEGQIWEAIMTAAHYELDNVCATVDRNFLEIDGNTEEVMALENLGEKYEAFNWHVIECNGHDVDELTDAYIEASKVKGKPTVVIANTIKGKGVSFMEDEVDWHGLAPDDEQYAQAIKELGCPAEYSK
jgi:transketolase